MKLAIITVNLNNRVGLQKTIDSVIAQTYKDFEWIIIDGGSTDGSRELIEQYADKFAYWVSELDNGIYNGMNKGIRLAHSEYLLFLNSGDTLHHADIISKVIPLLQGQDLYVGDSMTANGIDSLDLSTREQLIFTLLWRGFPHQSIFYRNSVFQRVGYYREDLKTCSDWIVNIQAIIFGNATVEKLPFVVSIFELGGISTRKDVVSKDLEKLVEENKNLSHIFGFYVKYFSIIEKIRKNRLLCSLGLWLASKRKWI